MNIESPYGGGVSSLPGATGSLLPVKFPVAPVLLAGGPQLGSWQVAVVWVDETPVGDASGREYPHAEQNRQRPIDISELHDGPGYTVVAGGPVGPCETPSPSSEESQDPLEHILDSLWHGLGLAGWISGVVAGVRRLLDHGCGWFLDSGQSCGCHVWG